MYISKLEGNLINENVQINGFFSLKHRSEGKLSMDSQGNIFRFFYSCLQIINHFTSSIIVKKLCSCYVICSEMR